MTTQPVVTFHYRLTSAYNVYQGAHPGQMTGAGQLFKHHEPLLASPDPRRIDLRASLLDAFGNYKVKVYQQHSKTTVTVIADLSASMLCPGMPVKRQFLCDFVLSAAQSAIDNGDSFSFIGCGKSLDRHWLLPPTTDLDAVREIGRRLATRQTRDNADSLLLIAPFLPVRRSLLFLVSDCHFSLEQLQRMLPPLTRHAVAPIVLWDAAECSGLPDWGLMRFKDAESRRSRTVLMRPALKQRMTQAFARRKILLQQTFNAFGMETLFLSGSYRADALTAHFLRQAL